MKRSAFSPTSAPGWTKAETIQVIKHEAVGPITSEAIARIIIKKHRKHHLPFDLVQRKVQVVLTGLQHAMLVRVTGELMVGRQGRRPQLYEWCGEDECPTTNDPTAPEIVS